MNTYPYYIITFLDGGILKKLFNDKKFKSYQDAVRALMRKCEVFPKFLPQNQITVLEYTGEHKGKIVTLFNYGELITINTPVKIE